MPSLKRCGGRRRRTASSGCFRAMPPTPGCSRSRMASSACASATSAGGSAMRATPSTPISYSRRCASKARWRKHLRFQVSLASVNSALPPRIFPNVADVAKVRPGFTDALAAEVDSIVKHIPNDDLAIQWDCSTEVQDAYGAVPGYSAEGAIERNIAQFRTLVAAHPGKCRARLPLLLRHARRLAALRARRSFGDRSSLPTPPSRRPAAASIGFTFPCCLTSKESFFAPLKDLQAARRARLSRRHPSHGRLQGAHRAGAEISCRNSGSRPIAASAASRRPTCRRCSTSIFRRSRPPVRARIRRRPVSPNRRSTRAPLRPRPHPRHRPRSPRRRRVEANKQSAWHGCARHGQRRRPLPCHPCRLGPRRRCGRKTA